MIKFEYNGNFGLDEIKGIWKKINQYNNFYEITFVNDDRTLFVSKLHAFVLEDGSCKSVENLKKGDVIWIDISAFTSDKSLINKK